MNPFFEIVSLSTDQCPVAPLQVTIKVDTDEIPCFSGSVTATVEGQAAAGVLEYPYCTFLFPLPQKETVVFRVDFHLDNMEIPSSETTVKLNKLPSEYVEKPYEFLGAQIGGFVLKKEHIFSSGPPNAAPHTETLDLICSHLISPVLDVGCGTGVYVKAFTEKGFSAKGIEVNGNYVEQGLGQNIDVAQYDGQRIPFPDNSFATVTAVEVIEHIENWQHFLNELLRVASRRVILTTPNIGVLSKMHGHNVVPWHILESTHVNFFTCEIWRHILLNIENASGLVKPYSKLVLNDENFFYNIYILIEKQTENQTAP